MRSNSHDPSTPILHYSSEVLKRAGIEQFSQYGLTEKRFGNYMDLESSF